MTGRIGTWTRTASGRRFYPLDPRPEDFCIEDIATGLSNVCRWSGQLPDSQWLSVAEHSMLVASLVPPEHALQALLHDAPEAYLGDVASPLKQLLPDYCDIERGVWSAIGVKLGVDCLMAPEVKEADVRALLAEAEFLFGHGATAGWQQREGRTIPPLRIRMLDPAQARAEFLTTYDMLVRQGRPTLAELASA